MRIQIRIKSNYTIIPYNHQNLLTGTIHKWLGHNNLHGHIALFSFSRLRGTKSAKEGLQTDTYCSFFISAYQQEVINKIIKGIFKDRTMFCGLEVEEVSIEEDPDMSTRDYFYIASPILIKRLTESGMKHYIYTEEQTDLLLKETLTTKLKQAGLEDDTLEIHFDRSYARASTKLVDYNGVKNRSNFCPVIIKGKPETKLFAWNVGLGNSTGIGFGAIM